MKLIYQIINLPSNLILLRKHVHKLFILLLVSGILKHFEKFANTKFIPTKKLVGIQSQLTTKLG